MSATSAEADLPRLAVDLVGHLAWPLTLVAMAILFAPTLRRMAGRVSHLEVGGARLSLSDRVRAAGEQARAAALTVVAPADGLRLGASPPGPAAPLPGAAPFGDAPDSSAAAIGDPRAAAREADLTVWVWSPGQGRGAPARSATGAALDYILDTLDKIERQMRGLAAESAETGGAAGGAAGEPPSLDAALGRLRARGVLDSRLFSLYESLAAIRREALGAGRIELAPREAAEWASLCLTLSQRLDQRARMTAPQGG